MFGREQLRTKRLTPESTTINIRSTDRSGLTEDFIKNKIQWQTLQEIFSTIATRSDLPELISPNQVIRVVNDTTNDETAAAVSYARGSYALMVKPMDANKSTDDIYRIDKTRTLIHELLHVASDRKAFLEKKAGGKKEEKGPIRQDRISNIIEEALNEMTARFVTVEYERRTGHTKAAKAYAQHWNKRVAHDLNSYSEHIRLLYRIIADTSLESGIDVITIRNSLMREHVSGTGEDKVMKELSGRIGDVPFILLSTAMVARSTKIRESALEKDRINGLASSETEELLLKDLFESSSRKDLGNSLYRKTLDKKVFELMNADFYQPTHPL